MARPKPVGYWTVPLRQHDRIDMPPVIGFAAMGHAAVAVELLGIGVGAGAEIRDRSDSCSGEAGRDIAGEVEHEMAVAGGGGEEPPVGGIGGDEAVHQVGADLV